MELSAVNPNYNVSSCKQNFVMQPTKTIPAFKAEEKADAFEKTNKSEEVKKEASTGKKWGVGIASAVLPGLGQAINGQWGKAAGFFFGAIGSGALIFVSPTLAIIAQLGLGIWSVVDAVKNVKPDLVTK